MRLSSFDIIKNGPPDLASSLYDKVYLSAQVHTSLDGTTVLSIQPDSMPAVRLNASVEVDLPTIAEVVAEGKYALFSSNVMLQIVGVGYPVIFRDEKAPVYPRHYTCIAGRCEHTPLNTAIAEVNEEIGFHIKNRETGETRLVGFCEPQAALAGKQHKEKYLKKELPELFVLPITWSKSPDKYRIEIDGKAVEEGTAYIIKDNGVVELCFPAQFTLPQGWDIVECFDGDGFNREVKILHSYAELDPAKCVPALREYLKRA